MPMGRRIPVRRTSGAGFESFKLTHRRGSRLRVELDSKIKTISEDTNLQQSETV